MAIKFRRRVEPRTNIDLVPMIDIVFQLVIFFMVATTFKTTTGMELKLPSAKEVAEISAAPIKVTITDNNNIFVEGIKTNLKSFEGVLKKKVINDPSIKQSVVIYGNKDIEYQLLIEVMDILRMNGFSDVDLAINKKF